jgi:hypothetical protein
VKRFAWTAVFSFGVVASGLLAQAPPTVSAPAPAPAVAVAAAPAAPQGTLSPKQTITSKIYDGMVSDYWTYAPAGYDPSKPAAPVRPEHPRTRRWKRTARSGIAR